ncbi:hypothetical protein L228DRAFT_238291 [Xylona heveae TC161]|uniref:NTF2-like protein n=1 Tax=Xylona heveae (strain CBS 132557 / TC161) TaxID=1328760 RepID=A0A165HN93_XYLHT|nr:hypothetical protein L228DRAFT_238291 [Xylona heveae TC161]KZF23769.1 hypothetical protein L228DRAFT_238291 [Xylona heveae TC161]
MSLKAAYQSFLADPAAAGLSEKAAINYIPTLTTINEPSSILKHLSSQQKLLRKKNEKVVNAIESQDALCLDVETTLEFIKGGGAYLPGLDDNFLADRTVTIPIIHIVLFDPQGKISQIRLHWDQGALLKSVDVIGSRGRNWPLHDGLEQLRLINSSTKSVGNEHSLAHNAFKTDPASAMANGRPQSPSKITATKDPHASLSLFEPVDDPEPTPSRPAPVLPRASAKPPPREYHDLFAEQEVVYSPSPSVNSPERRPGSSIAPKGGNTGKNFQPSRLFDAELSPAEKSVKASERLYRPNPKRYEHFTFGDGEDEHAEPSKQAPVRSKSDKHGSQWDFEDFDTPEKVRTKVRAHEVRHFGWSEEDGDYVVTPVKDGTKAAKPRRDAEKHFEFQDDGTPQGAKRPTGPPRGASHNAGLGLYKNNLFGDEDHPPQEAAHPDKPLGNVTNINRNKIFDPHFSLADFSPAAGDKADAETKPVPEDRKKAVKMMMSNWDSYDRSPDLGAEKTKPAPEDHKKAVKMMTANWGLYDQSPDAMGAQKENVTHRGIKTGGDGMGGRKGTRSWAFGEESDSEKVSGPVPTTRRFPGATKQQADKNFWDF